MGCNPLRALWIRAALLLLAALSMPPAGAADLHVGARLLKVTRVQVLSQPAHVQVTEADIARGYVEVAAPMQLAVRSNAPEGYLLAFEQAGQFFRQAHVRGLPRPVQLAGSGGVVQQPPAGRGFGQVVHALAFRFELAKDTPAGIHPWPVHVSAEPL